MDENKKELHQVIGINQRMKSRERFDKLKHQGKEAVKVPVEAVKQEVSSSSHNEGMQGQEKVKAALRPVSHIVGDITDNNRREEYLQKIKYNKNEGLAGDRLYQSMRSGSNDIKIEFDNLTEGDLKAWKALKKNPQMDKDKFYQIKDCDNTRAVLNRKTRKTIIEIKKAYAVNAYEENVREFALQNRQLFTDKQMKIIEDENGLFHIKNSKDLYINREIHNIYMKHLDEAGTFKDLQFIRMKGAEYKNIVLRKTSTNYKFFRPDSSKYEIGCYAGWWLSEKQEGLKNIGLGGDKRSHLFQGGFDALLGNEVRNSELGQSYTFVKGMAKVSQIAVKTGWQAGKLGYTAGHKGIGLAGKGVITGLEGIDKIREQTTGKGITESLNQTWNKKAADKLKNAGYRYMETENKINHTAETIKTAPKKIADRAVYKAANKIKNTKAVQKIKQVKTKAANSKIGKGVGKLGRGLKKAKHTAMTPFRLIGKIIDVIKKKIMMPVIIVLGIIFLVMILLSSLSLVSSSSSSITFLILDDEEHFKDFQEKYDSFDAAFIAQVDGVINGYAKTTNKKGQQIRYGVNGSLNEEGNQNEDYKKGVELNYFIDGIESEGISSNIEDCLSVMAVIMQQQQAEYHKEAVELLEALYKSSHTYHYWESGLYGCDSGCETTEYYCNEIKAEEGETGTIYWSTEMKFNPWTYEELVKPSGECVVCKKKAKYSDKGEGEDEGEGLNYKDYAGCMVVGTCYHGDEEGKLGRRHTGCDHYQAVWDCDHDCDNEDCSHDCSESSLGCAGYYVCEGHDHYGCLDGHKVKTCFGHVDIAMNVNIASLDRLLEMGNVSKFEEGGEKGE